MYIVFVTRYSCNEIQGQFAKFDGYILSTSCTAVCVDSISLLGEQTVDMSALTSTFIAVLAPAVIAGISG